MDMGRSATRRASVLKPCPFCGGRAIQIVEPRILVNCVWIECSSCRLTSPMIEYTALKGTADEKLHEARAQLTEYWNTRA